MSMFCYQCEQTLRGKGCTQVGVCGKDAETASLQDLLVTATKEISWYAHRARKKGVRDDDLDQFSLEALFTTVTNVNFDAQDLLRWLNRANTVRAQARRLYETACGKDGCKPEAFCASTVLTLVGERNALLQQAHELALPRRSAERGEDVVGLEELVTYGLKGMAAYAHHALMLGHRDDDLFAFVHEALSFLTEEHTAEELTAMALRVGERNLRSMELLDTAHTTTYGHPEPTSVRIDPVRGKAILVSGHDLKDLAELLKQTQGKGINVYTHGEMLPALAYPALKEFPHLVGNYGGAWQDQAREFEAFPGPIVMTTNCIQKPRPTYQDRIFTCGLVAWPGVRHIENRDFSVVIESALSVQGFTAEGAGKRILIGFARNAVLATADKIVEAVKKGAIKHFFLVGGCDGAEVGRNYYTQFVEQSPKDTVVLTLACGKYRFNKMDLGEIDGIPRLLDVGQCNDAYSAIQIAQGLAKAFGTNVNALPLSLVLSWYEQKAVAILLTLLHLGLRDIRLGPKLPAFLTPPVLDVLIEKFALKPIGSPEADRQVMLGG